MPVAVTTISRRTPETSTAAEARPGASRIQPNPDTARDTAHNSPSGASQRGRLSVLKAMAAMATAIAARTSILAPSIRLVAW
jgi:hypothetical protein